MTRRTDPARVKRAATHPDRPGSNCESPPGSFIPVVHRSRCEGKRDCEAVCPYSVFEIRPIDDADWQPLSWLSKLKLTVHGRLTAYTPRADACRGCGLCVVACPEKAIELHALSSTSSTP